MIDNAKEDVISNIKIGFLSKLKVLAKFRKSNFAIINSIKTNFFISKTQITFIYF